MTPAPRGCTATGGRARSLGVQLPPSLSQRPGSARCGPLVAGDRGGASRWPSAQARPLAPAGGTAPGAGPPEPPSRPPLPLPSRSCAPFHALSTSALGGPFTAASNNLTRSVDPRAKKMHARTEVAGNVHCQWRPGPFHGSPQAALSLTEDPAISGRQSRFLYLMRKREEKK